MENKNEAITVERLAEIREQMRSLVNELSCAARYESNRGNNYLANWLASSVIRVRDLNNCMGSAYRELVKVENEIINNNLKDECDK